MTDASRPLPPNVIQVGGIHLNPPQKIPNVSDLKNDDIFFLNYPFIYLYVKYIHKTFFL